jgi:hypothetical protein
VSNFHRLLHVPDFAKAELNLGLSGFGDAKSDVFDPQNDLTSEKPKSTSLGRSPTSELLTWAEFA